MLILLGEQRKPIIRLVRVQQTTSGKTWIFDFVDPVHKFAQSIIAPKAVPPEYMEALYEKMWVNWTQKIKEEDWRSGNAPIMPLVA